jgi:hypothetical protein
MHRVFIVSLGATLAIGGAALFASCTDDSNEDGTSAVISGISFLDGAGFHDIDESINDSGDIPAAAATTARHAQAVTNLTDWPDEFDDDAEALETVFANLATELEKEEPDIEAAGELAAQAHDGLHDFSHSIWNHLQSEAGIQVPEESEDHN